MKHLLFLLLLACAANAHAQCDQFDRLLIKGDNFLKGKKPDYQEAINAYTAAILACSDRAGEAQKRIAKMVSDINQLKENALAAERKAIKAQEETEIALARVKEEQQKTQAALLRSDSLYEVAQAVLDKIYFYNGCFGLAYDKNSYRYGFIDKQLNTKIDFQYMEAQPFDYTGYAKVKKDDHRYYLIDTTGAEFLLATDVSQLTPKVTALDLRNKKLSKIPGTVFSQTQLKVLLLNYNKIDTLPAEVGQLKNLQSLGLSYNNLSALPAEVGQLKNLQSLDLRRNQLSALPAEVGQLKNLQSLDLSDNQLSALPAEVGQLKNLQSLDLSDNQLSALPAEVGQLKNLQSLDLSDNQLSALPAEVGQLKNLQSLDLSDNQLSALPAEVGQLKNLQSLDLLRNQLSALPAEVGQLKNLQVLILSYNQLSSLPAEIGQLKNLQVLILSYNQLSSLPAEIGQLKNLQVLYLTSSRLSSLPAEIGQLKNLQVLILSYNQLSSLPAEIGQLKNLQVLILSYNQLSSLPAEIGQLKNLHSLGLYDNDSLSFVSIFTAFRDFSKPIMLATNVNESNHDEDKLLIIVSKQATLFAEIGQLKNLHSLNLSFNQLSALPAEVGQLKNLQSLNLDDNQLSSLPAEIRSMKSLKYLNVQENPFPPDYIEQLRKDMPWCAIEWVSPEIKKMMETVEAAGAAANEAFEARNYALFDSLYQVEIATLRELYAQDSAQYKEVLGSALGSYSFDVCFTNHPGKAIAAGNEAARLLNETWPRTNEGHGYLLTGQWEQAKEVYLAIKETDGETLWKDFQDLAKAGVRHPDMIKAAELVLGRALTEEERTLIEGKK